MEIRLVGLDSELWETFRGAYRNVSNEIAILWESQSQNSR